MTPIALTWLILSLTILWGGLAASTVFLARRGEIERYPDDPEDDARFNA